MKWFHDLAIATRLIVSFVTVLVLMALLGIMSIVRLADVNQTGTELANNWLPSIQTAGDIRAGLSRFRTLELQHVVSTEPTDMAGYEQQMNTVLADLNKDKQRYERLISSPEERKLYDEMAGLLGPFMAEHDKVIALSRELKTEEAVAATRGQANRLFEQLIQRIDAIVKLNREGGAKADAEGNTLYESSRLWIVIQLLVAIAVGLTLAIWQSRTLARSLKEAVAVAQRVAAGDLTSTIEVRSKDETGQLMAALKAMNDSLVGIVSEVRSGTDTIATASGQIASGNLDLSSRTEEQASSLEETASSMEELTSTVKQNADNARQANGLVQSAATVAARGGEVVAQVVDTMGAINESSRKIVDIISVIDGIAFQTNILALNAAVEAARAGEQGRGFAVVAGEVRTLAQRSANAAKEIKALIDDSVGKVDTGARLVNDAGATMKSIMDSVNSVAAIMGEISMASQEQTSGIDQINQAIVQMDQVTQQNAALVEEAAAASEAMQEQAGKLSDAVAVFKLNGRYEAKAAPVHVQAARIEPVAKPVAKVAVKAAVKPAVTRSAPQLARAAAVKEDEWEQF